MKRLLSCAVVMVLVGFAGVQPLEAQRGGFGGFMDFINKLSGPSINGGGASAWVALGGEIRETTTNQETAPSPHRL